MSDRPLVSIVTATYNALEGLKETVASVSSQTTDDYEHIVVDGASTDGTPEWLEAEGAGLRWISEPDGGIADAMNKGVALSRGDWILVLHSGDTFLHTNSLEEAIQHLHSDADVVCFDVAFATEGSTRRLPTSGLAPRLNWKPFPHQGAFTRTKLFDTIGEFDTSYKISMDYEFFMRAYRYSSRSQVEHMVVTMMPGTGVSSRRDWDSTRRRFKEEKRVHVTHSPSLAFHFMYSVYWRLYLVYRRVRATVFDRQ